ncbi:MAG: metallophosphoesterase [Elusimicrobiaceae bacterium]|nr:metallophosphoesterase [Elusimicrobiaceae bacterium]
MEKEFMVFFVVASIILLLMQIAVGLWFYFIFPSIGWKMPAVVVPLCMTLFIRWAMVYTRTHYGTFESLCYYAAYIWAGIVFIAFCIVIAFALLQLIGSLCHIQARAVLGPVSMVVLMLATALSIYGGWSQPKLKHIYLTFPNAPELTIAVLSDSHLGEGVSLARFQKALTRIQAQKPDMLLVLGDLFEYGMHRSQYAQALKDFHTLYGTFGVFGNHEYYMGYQNSVDFYQEAGVRLLQNQYETLPNGVQIIGINDIKTAHVTEQMLDNLLEQTDPDKLRLLLSHQPLLVEVAARHQIPLMLSGHTHNGQLLPFNLLVKLQYDYIYGLYQTGPHSNIYVTSGMFYWGMPLRLFAPAEIAILHIQNHEK